MSTVPGTMDEIKLVSHNGRDVRVDFGQYTMSPQEAMDFARNLQRAAGEAEIASDLHERHVNLRADCPLCRYEAGGQIDRLATDDEEAGLDEEVSLDEVYCKYGHYEEGNKFLPECINELTAKGDPRVTEEES